MVAAVVNAVGGHGNGAGPFASAPFNSTNGNTLVVAIREQAGQGGTSIPFDNVAGSPNTYALIAIQDDGVGSSQIRAYRAENIVGRTGHIVSVGYSTSGDPSFGVIEAGGVDAASYDAGTLGQGQKGGQPWNTIPSGTLVAGSLVVSLIGNGGGVQVYSVAAPFTKDVEDGDGGSYWTGAIGTAVAPSTTPMTPNWTSTGGTQGAMMVFALKPSSGPAPYPLTAVGNIASAEAFGVAVLGATVAPAGIASAQAFGAPSLRATLAPAGIATAEAFGTPAITARLTPVGIATAEAFGVPSLRANLQLVGISTAEAFGVPSLSVGLQLIGIGTAEAFGVPMLDSGINPEGIASAEAFGVPTLTPVPVTELHLVGIASAEAWGVPSLSAGVQPVGISSAEAFGVPRVGATVITGPTQWINTDIPSELRLSTIAGESRFTEVPAHA